MDPRPNHSDRSRSRSLLSQRTSSSSTGNEAFSDEPVPDVPSLDGAGADTRAGAGDNGQSKSPLLTAHRISVTSDMDDVSLDEGKPPSPYEKLCRWWSTVERHANVAGAFASCMRAYILAYGLT